MNLVHEERHRWPRLVAADLLERAVALEASTERRFLRRLLGPRRGPWCRRSGRCCGSGRRRGRGRTAPDLGDLLGCVLTGDKHYAGQVDHPFIAREQRPACRPRALVRLHPGHGPVVLHVHAQQPQLAGQPAQHGVAREAARRNRGRLRCRRTCRCRGAGRCRYGRLRATRPRPASAAAVARPLAGLILSGCFVRGHLAYNVTKPIWKSRPGMNRLTTGCPRYRVWRIRRRLSAVCRHSEEQ